MVFFYIFDIDFILRQIADMDFAYIRHHCYFY